MVMAQDAVDSSCGILLSHYHNQNIERRAEQNQQHPQDRVVIL